MTKIYERMYRMEEEHSSLKTEIIKEQEQIIKNNDTVISNLIEEKALALIEVDSLREALRHINKKISSVYGKVQL